MKYYFIEEFLDKYPNVINHNDYLIVDESFKDTSKNPYFRCSLHPNGLSAEENWNRVMKMSPSIGFGWGDPQGFFYIRKKYLTNRVKTILKISDLLD